MSHRRRITITAAFLMTSASLTACSSSGQPDGQTFSLTGSRPASDGSPLSYTLFDEPASLLGAGDSHGLMVSEQVLAYQDRIDGSRVVSSPTDDRP